MMVGARWQHNIIVGNLSSELRSKLRQNGAGCQVSSGTFWLKERFLKLAVFPDVMVRCGPRLADDPLVLVEVASPGRGDRDRVEKDGLYRRLPTLQHYGIVARDLPRIDVVDRNGTGWSIQRVDARDSRLDLPALDLSIPLAEICRDVLDRES